MDRAEAQLRRGTAAALLAGLIVLAGALRFVGLHYQSFWFDETATVEILRLPSLGDVFTAVPKSESTPPLYYAVAWCWTQLTGTHEVGVRSLSALLGTATVPLVWAAGRRLASEWAGLAAAAIVAVNPMLVWYSQEARAYAMLVFFGALSFWLMTRALDRGTPGSWLAWGVASALMIATHYFGVFVVVAEAAWSLWRLPERRRQVLLGALPAVAVGIALLPLAIHQEATGGRTSWIAASDIGGRIGDVVSEVFTANTVLVSSNSPSPEGRWVILGVLGLVAGVAGLLIGGAGDKRRKTMAAAWVGALAIILPLVLVPTGLDFFKDRNLIAAWAPLAVALGVGLATRRIAPFGLLGGLAIIAGGIGVSVSVMTTSALQRTNWRAGARTIGRPVVARAVIVRPGYARTSLAVYGHMLVPMPVDARVSELVLTGPEILAPNAQPPRLPQFHLEQYTRIRDLAVLRYRSAHPLTYTAQVLSHAGGPVLLEPSLSARRWFTTYFTLAHQWNADASRALTDPAARGRLRRAPVDVSRLTPLPPEFPATRHFRHLTQLTAEAARALAAHPSPQTQASLRRMLMRMVTGR